MRLATVRQDGTTRLFAMRASGHFIDVVAAAGSSASSVAGVVDVGTLYRRGPRAVEEARRVAASDAAGRVPSFALDDLDLAPPVTAPRAIVCIGRNYASHIEEGNAPTPAAPVLFSKYPNTLVGDGDGVIHHAITSELDYEGELAVIVGQRASRVAEADAWSYVAGYTVLNDISARDLQLGDLQWIRGKSLDTFCPMGPLFVSADEIADVDALRIRTLVNGETRQDAPAGEMIFKIPRLLAFITEGITLEPGDIIATGTPSGVAYGMNPRVYLRPGDLVEVTIDGIGTLRSPIVAAS